MDRPPRRGLIQVLIPICRSLLHIKTLYATILDSLFHTPVQIRVNVLGIKLRVTKHCYDFLQFLQLFLVMYRIYCYILVYTRMKYVYLGIYQY